MKYPKLIEEIPYNNLKSIMEERKISALRLSVLSGVSRSSIGRMYNNPYANITVEKSFLLEKALHVDHSELFTSVFRICITDDPNGFSEENLLILNTEIKKNNLPSLKYNIYSNSRTMKFEMKYSNNRRFYLNGYMRFYYYEMPEFDIINFDWVKNRTNISASKYKYMYQRYLECFLNFAKTIGIFRVKLCLTISETYDGMGSIEKGIVEKMGFVKNRPMKNEIYEVIYNF